MADIFGQSSRTRILDNLDQSGDAIELLELLNVDLEDSDTVIETLTRGISGDDALRQAAISYLSNVDAEKYVARIDRDVLQYVGIDPVFAMALLHSFGPHSHSGDFGDDDSEGIRGLLQIPNPPLCKHKGRTALCMIYEEDAWYLEVNVALTDNIYWRTDFRGDTDHDGPDILAMEQTIPAAMATRLVGQPLSGLMAHPVLDRFPLTIDAITQDDPDFIVDVGNAAGHMTFDELIAQSSP